MHPYQLMIDRTIVLRLDEGNYMTVETLKSVVDTSRLHRITSRSYAPAAMSRGFAW
jgi:hypothetical protein